jgi:FkbM family methyltransferase
MLKSLLRSLLRRRGLELKPIGAPIRGPDNYIRHIKAKGFAPGTVIDIGVATGTPWLYQFPEARLVLVEPNPEFRSDLERISAEHRADILPFAAGVEAAALDLNVDLVAPSSSSFLTVSADLQAYWRGRGQARPTETRKVDVRPLDAMIDDRYPVPYLIKIDTEGFELEVLNGAAQTLAKAECLIVETSVATRHEGSYVFADLIAFLAEHGFAFSDILDVQNFSGSGDISYMDIAFVRASDGGTKRASKLPALKRTLDAAV